MLSLLRLLLPALIPSWRFFDRIAPSPRIEFALRASADASATWQEFRPRPEHLSFGAMLVRLFWNPRWNESLYLTYCAERLMEGDVEFRSQEIVTCVARDLALQQGFLQFRLVFLCREGAELQKHITFTSPLIDMAGL